MKLAIVVVIARWSRDARPAWAGDGGPMLSTRGWFCHLRRRPCADGSSIISPCFRARGWVATCRAGGTAGRGRTTCSTGASLG